MAMDERTYSKYFKAFGDQSRLRILSLLAGGEMTVNDIARKVKLSQPTVSRHLGILREAEVVIDRREGQQVFYSLNKTTVKDCCCGFCDCLAVPIPVSGRSSTKNKK
jgi:DNA-binding transcriptional ArsR family regulator